MPEVPLLKTDMRMPSPSAMRIGSGFSFCVVSRMAGRGFRKLNRYQNAKTMAASRCDSAVAVGTLL